MSDGGLLDSASIEGLRALIEGLRDRPDRHIFGELALRLVELAPLFIEPGQLPPFVESGVAGSGVEAARAPHRPAPRVPPPMSTIVLMTPREVSKQMRCSQRKLERHRLVGDGPPYVKIGAAIRYPLPWFETWLAERMQRSTSETGPPRQPPTPQGEARRDRRSSRNPRRIKTLPQDLRPRDVEDHSQKKHKSDTAVRGRAKSPLALGDRPNASI